MTQRIKPDVKALLDSAITDGIQPSAPRNGIGLNLKIGAKHRAIVNKK